MLFHTFPKFTQSWLIAGYSGLGFCPRITYSSDMRDGICLSTFTSCGDEAPRRLNIIGAWPSPELHTVLKGACGFRRIFLLRGWVNKGPRKGRGLRPGPGRASTWRPT